MKRANRLLFAYKLQIQFVIDVIFLKDISVSRIIFIADWLVVMCSQESTFIFKENVRECEKKY